MNSSGKPRKRAPRCLIFGSLCFLVAYLLSLCTLNPQVHAETLRRVVHQRPDADHCSSATATSASPRQTPQPPLCCEVRGGSNKATLKSASVLNASVLAGFLFLPREARLLHAPSFPYFPQARLRLLHPPPFYRLHQIFLI